MKKTIALLSLCISMIFAYARNNITGTWEGTLDIGGRGNSLRVVFHFNKQRNGLYSGSLDSPDQGVNGIHCDNVIVKKDSVIVQIKTISGGFNGLRINDSTIDGIWAQGVFKIPVTFKKVKAEKIIDQNADSNCVETGITLETKTGQIFGTLCTPIGFVNGPVTLIIAGSGPTDRDGNGTLSLKTDAYKILAHKLAAQHIATVRYDKRGVGQSAVALKSEADIRFDDYIKDATGWITMLKSDKRFTKIVVIGHSEGSLVGMVAAREGKADGYVSIAGAGQSIDKILKMQLQDIPPGKRDTAYMMLDSLKAGKIVKHVEPEYYSLFRPSVQPYIISWIKYDPAIEISKLKIPVLIIQGTNDIQVSVDDAKKLSAADKRAKLVLLQNMNHIFRVVEGDKQANVATYNEPDLPIDPELVTTIADFINEK